MRLTHRGIRHITDIGQSCEVQILARRFLHERRKVNKMIDIGKDLQNAFDEGYKARDSEIVRCKDCKHYMQTSCPMTGTWATDEDFCSFGERRKE